MNFKELNDWLYYDESSPSGLRWKIDVRGGRKKCIKVLSAGDVAGSFGQGYWRTTVRGKRYLNHRIILCLHGVDMDGVVADHIDGVSSNNVYTNLRVGNALMNSHNCARQRNNTSGVAGVKWTISNRSTYGDKYVSAMCSWEDNGVRKTKCFSVSAHGLLPAFAMACAYREKMLLQLNKDGCFYSDRHGKTDSVNAFRPWKSRKVDASPPESPLT